MKQAKRILAAAACAFLTGPAALSAESLNLEERVQAFATCAGRLSALATRQRALHDPGSEVTGQLSSTFETLLAATLPDADSGIDETRAVQWRAAGWVEVAHLLGREHYADDSRDIDRARADLARRITICQRLVL